MNLSDSKDALYRWDATTGRYFSQDAEKSGKMWDMDNVTAGGLARSIEADAQNQQTHIGREVERPVQRSVHLNNQVGGDHYSKLKIQPSEYCNANNFGYWQILTLRYITRYKDKNGRQDLEKAIDCIQHLIAEEYGSD